MSMSINQYRKTVRELGHNFESIAPFLGISTRTSRRYATDTEAPEAVRKLFAVMLAKKIKTDDPVFNRGKK